MTTAAATLSQRERELAAIIAAYHDVTEQLKGAHEDLSREVCKLRVEVEDKNRELARRQRLAALGAMAAGVAHEIRNPLGSIQLYASLLERDLAALPAAQRLVNKISAGVDALDAIVGDVLEFAGPHQPRMAWVSAGAMIRQVSEAAGPRLCDKEAELRLHPGVDQLQLCVDRSQMERALLNLVLNAVDAVDPGGCIEISGEAGDGGVRLHVSDDGCGIDDAVIDHIFNPFFTTKDCGTGLGLAIVHRIVDSHGGSITVSRRTDGGTRFTVHLPDGAVPDPPQETSWP